MYLSKKYEQNIVNLNGLEVVFSGGKLKNEEEVSLFSDAIDLVFCLSGNAKWKIGKNYYQQVSSELLFFSIGTCYKLVSTDEETLIIRVRYSREQISRNLEEELFSCYSVDCDQLKGKLNKFGLDLVDSILNHHRNIDVNNQDSIAEVTYKESEEIITCVSQFIEKNYFCLKKVSPRHSIKYKTKEAIQRIVNKDDGNYNLEVLSNELGISRSYLTRIFKTDLGIVPSFYLTARKINKSLSLIQDKNNELCNIAYDLGFSDQSHFSNIFKKYLLITPGQLKKPLKQSLKDKIMNSFTKLFP